MANAFLAALRRRLPKVPEPTLAGRIALTFLFLAFWATAYTDRNALLHVVCALLATLLLSAVITHLATGALTLQRRLPRRVFAGQSFDVRLRITNRSRWRPALALAFRDALQIGEPGESTCGPELPVLSPGATVEMIYQKRLHRRGHHKVVNALAATRFPFGLFEQRLLLAQDSAVLVLPALGRLHRSALRDLDRRPLAVPVRRTRSEGIEEFHSLREFRPGDSPRTIHWKTSARIGTLVRRVLREEQGEDLVVVLDTRIEGRDAATRLQNFERAISCAATILAHAARRGRRAAVYHAGGVVRHSGTPAGLLFALEQLAHIQGGGVKARELIERGQLRSGATALLLSLSGPASKVQSAARGRGIELRVWDLADARFERNYRKA